MARPVEDGRFPAAALHDIRAGKRAARRASDIADVPRLEQFNIQRLRRTGW